MKVVRIPVMAVLLVAVGCLSTAPIGIATAGATGAASPGFSITTTPALRPTFSPSVKDYAIRCTQAPTTALVTTGTGPVQIGQTVRNGPVSVKLPLIAGQEVKVTSGGSAYNIRCLPSDFPHYSATVTGTPQATGYFVTIAGYSVMFDTDGVPVWWFKKGYSDAKFFSPTTVGWAELKHQTYQIRSLDGKLLHTVGGGSVPLDPHDLQLLPNGNYLAITDAYPNCPGDPAQCVDLSSWGQSSQADIYNNSIVELDPSNNVVWHWSLADHVDVATENANWRNAFPDVFHMNSIEYDGNGGIILSARHLDAVYRIDMATGDVTWKLGGTTTPQSLAVTGDEYVASGGQLFSGQHDARLEPNGTLTLHDNGSRANRAPRALQFSIDATTMTATELAQVTDPRAPTSPYTGSAEELAGGDWVMSWGGNGLVTELNAQGVPQMTIKFPEIGVFSYRDADVDAPVSALRAGMNAMVAPSAGPTG